MIPTIGYAKAKYLMRKGYFAIDFPDGKNGIKTMITCPDMVDQMWIMKSAWKKLRQECVVFFIKDMKNHPSIYYWQLKERRTYDA